MDERLTGLIRQAEGTDWRGDDNARKFLVIGYSFEIFLVFQSIFSSNFIK